MKNFNTLPFDSAPIISEAVSYYNSNLSSSTPDAEFGVLSSLPVLTSTLSANGLTPAVAQFYKIEDTKTFVLQNGGDFLVFPLINAESITVNLYNINPGQVPMTATQTTNGLQFGYYSEEAVTVKDSVTLNSPMAVEGKSGTPYRFTSQSPSMSVVLIVWPSPAPSDLSTYLA